MLAEDLVALWRIRDRLVNAPHMRVAALVMTDERVEAHLDAVRTGLRSVRSRAVLTAREKELHSIFVSAVVALAEADPEQRWARIVHSLASRRMRCQPGRRLAKWLPRSSGRSTATPASDAEPGDRER